MGMLVCDLCGGKLVMGPGGIATCESCGMEHSQDRMKEKVQEVKGTVRIDNSHMIDNYLELATNAYDSKNQAEAESYCNKIIEIEPTNYKAWLIKGKAAGWQSTLQNPRFSESVSAFSKAIANAPEEEKETIISDSQDEIIKLAMALISLRADRFKQWPDEDEAAGFVTDITLILNTVVQFVNQAGIVIPLEKMMAPIAKEINQSVVGAWTNKILPDYQGDENRPNQYEWKEFIKRIGYCTILVEKAIELCNEDDEEDIQRYENLIFLHEQAINSCSWDYSFTDWGKVWNKEYTLTNEAKASRRKLINEYKQKIQQIKQSIEAKQRAEQEEKARIEKEAADKRFKEYWEAHAEEKNTLESEKRRLEQEIYEYNNEISQIPGKKEKENIQERINRLEDEKRSLGLFKSKEKKELQDKIDEASKEMKIVSDKMDAAKSEIQEKLNPLQNRLREINLELTKPR